MNPLRFKEYADIGKKHEILFHFSVVRTLLSFRPILEQRVYLAEPVSLQDISMSDKA